LEIVAAFIARSAMLELPNVTLCCADTKNQALAIRALRRSMCEARFGRVLFFTSDTFDSQDIEVRTVAIESRSDYSRFIAKGLLPHVRTDFVLIVQWDGYVVAPQAWEDGFLEFDYLGAPWPYGGVGNGGFSLRSRRLLNALQDERIFIDINEDQAICGSYRPELERVYGIRFGTTEVADRFSFEMRLERVLSGMHCFGFHGLSNFALVESEAEICSVIEALSERALATEMAKRLLVNCRAKRMFRASSALAGRMKLPFNWQP
jgi:hypothetical protein